MRRSVRICKADKIMLNRFKSLLLSDTELNAQHGTNVDVCNNLRNLLLE